MAYNPAAQKRYNEKNYTFVTLKLHNEKDAKLLQIIERYAAGTSRQAAVKQLIMQGAGLPERDIGE